MTEKNTQPTTEDVVATTEPTSEASVEAKTPQATTDRPQGGRGGARGGNGRSNDRGGNGRNDRRGGGRRRRDDQPQDEFESKIIDLARVTRVMAGGKRMSFRACVIVGDK